MPILKLKFTIIWMLNTTVKSELELQLNHSLLYSIQDHQTYGSQVNNVDSQLHAIFTNISTATKAPLMLKMELTSISPTDQVLLLDI